MSDETVPFGKYRGQPVEVLQNDKQYCDWLSGQDWFRDKYQNIFNVIINNFAEPSETPEHNAIQVMFLDEGFCISVMTEYCKNKMIGGIYKDPDGWKIHCFENCGWDAVLERNEERRYVEIKSSVGDDYPTVLRQMKAREHVTGSILLIDKYTGIGATKEQMVKTFELSKIIVVWLDDVKKIDAMTGAGNE